MTIAAVVALCVTLSSAFAFVFAKAGLYAALKCAIRKHTPAETACLKCLRERNQ